MSKDYDKYVIHPVEYNKLINEMGGLERTSNEEGVFWNIGGNVQLAKYHNSGHHVCFRLASKVLMEDIRRGLAVEYRYVTRVTEWRVCPKLNGKYVKIQTNFTDDNWWKILGITADGIRETIMQGKNMSQSHEDLLSYLGYDKANYSLAEGNH